MIRTEFLKEYSACYLRNDQRDRNGSSESIRRLVGGGGMAALREAVMETEGPEVLEVYFRFVIWRQDQMRMDQMEASAETPGCKAHGYELGKHFLVEGTARLETESGELLEMYELEAEAEQEMGTYWEVRSGDESREVSRAGGGARLQVSAGGLRQLGRLWREQWNDRFCLTFVCTKGHSRYVVGRRRREQRRMRWVDGITDSMDMSE